MRILFRGKDINTNKWCYGGYVRKVLFKNTKDEKIRHYIFDGENAGPIVMHEVDPDTVGQYTGVKDCNKNEIFNGDILQNPNDGTLGIVFWKNEEARFKVEMSRVIPEDDIVYYQVIGNIWDNKDLFKKIKDKD